VLREIVEICEDVVGRAVDLDAVNEGRHDAGSPDGDRWRRLRPPYWLDCEYG
jgi:hypothetical protein